jgi:hypothetical protein
MSLNEGINDRGKREFVSPFLDDGHIFCHCYRRSHRYESGVV